MAKKRAEIESIKQQIKEAAARGDTAEIQRLVASVKGKNVGCK